MTGTFYTEEKSRFLCWFQHLATSCQNLATNLMLSTPKKFYSSKYFQTVEEWINFRFWWHFRQLSSTPSIITKPDWISWRWYVPCIRILSFKYNLSHSSTRIKLHTYIKFVVFPNGCSMFEELFPGKTLVGRRWNSQNRLARMPGAVGRIQKNIRKWLFCSFLTSLMICGDIEFIWRKILLQIWKSMCIGIFDNLYICRQPVSQCVVNNVYTSCVFLISILYIIYKSFTSSHIHTYQKLVGL